jgi:5-methylthioadenosine/S-adenosylhomocysteine deaminase
MTSSTFSASANSQPVPADLFITATWLVPMHERGKILKHHGLVVTDGRIVAIGPASELVAQYQATSSTHLDNHVLLPGLVNAHGHAAMTLLRGYADDLPLQTWLTEKIWPAESRWVGEDFVRDGSELAIAEMLLGGTTCFSDMYFFPEQVAEAASNAGIRACLNTPVLDFPTAWARDANEYIDKGTRLHDACRDLERITVSFGPHAPYTVSDEPLLKIAMYAEELDLGIHMHVHENPREIEDAMQHHGMRPLTRLKQLDLIGPRLQCVHMTQLNDEEIALIASHNASVVHCPSSNMKLASGICRVPDLLDAGVCVALGTDGAASNNNLDMFLEMRLAAFLGKTGRADAGALPAWDVLCMATRNGAKLLGMEHDIGTLEPGKLADMIAVDLDAPNTLPVYDPVSALVYSASSAQVTQVWVQGQQLVSNRQLVRLNQASLMKKAAEWAAKINRSE